MYNVSHITHITGATQDCILKNIYSGELVAVNAGPPTLERKNWVVSEDALKRWVKEKVESPTSNVAHWTIPAEWEI